MPQDFLDGLDLERRHSAWEGILGAADWPRSGTLVAEHDSDVIGFPHICPTRDDDDDPSGTGEVAMIYLLPGEWRKGVGRALMDSALATLREAGFEDATLWVLDTNERARRFYETTGWLANSATRRVTLGGLPLDEVRYRRRLG